MNNASCMNFMFSNREVEQPFNPTVRDLEEFDDNTQIGTNFEYDICERRYKALSERCRKMLDLLREDSPQKVPSLLYLAIIQVAKCLYSQKCIRQIIRQMWLSAANPSKGYSIETFYCKNLESTIISNLGTLQLPPNVEQNALDIIVGPMCAEIYYFVEFHSGIFFSEYPDSFCWTTKGKIDFVKTARQLIADSSYTKCEQFSVACIYCFKNEVIKLFSQDTKYLTDRNLVTFWKYLLSGKLYTYAPQAVGQKTAPEWGFSYAVCCASESAIKYFADQIHGERKSAFVFFFLKYIMQFNILHSPECFIHLFPLMQKKDQIQWLHVNAGLIFKCFLRWSWLEYFMPLVKIFLSSLTSTAYLKVIQDISIRIKQFPHCTSYKRVFEEFWRSSPIELKNHTIGKCINGNALSILLHNENETGIEVILKDATAQQRSDMIFSPSGMENCCYLIKYRKWKLLEMFIVKCLTCKDFLVFQGKFSDHVSKDSSFLTDLDRFSSFCAIIREKYFSTCEE